MPHRTRASCGPGKIWRKSYRRKSSKGKVVRVSGKCIKGRGLMGHGQKLGVVPKPGGLSGLGWHASDPDHVRLHALVMAVQRSPSLYASIMRRLSWLHTVQRNQNPAFAAIVARDMAALRKATGRA